MARATPNISNFTAGELDPRLVGRHDLEKYFNGAATMYNALPFPLGYAQVRPGTYYVAAVKDHAKATVLVRFEFNDEQAYMLEFGDQYVRFYKDRGQITSGGSAYEIESPYLEADLERLWFAQSADTLFICHASYAPRQLSRTAHDAWTLAECAFVDGPYLPENTTNITLTPGAVTGVDIDFNDVGWNGSNLYVGVGKSGKIMTSADGATWTERSSGVTTELQAVYYANSLWVAVGNSGVILTSTNGTTWTSRTSGVTANLYAVHAADISGYKWVVGGSSGKVLYATDPTSTWTEKNLSVTTRTVRGIAYTGTRWILAAYYVTTTGNIYTTEDITVASPTYTSRTLPTGGTNGIYDIAWNGSNLAVAVEYGGKIITSADGITWALATSPTASHLYAVRYGHSLWNIVGASGVVVTSANGSTFTLRSSGITDALHSTVYGAAHVYVGYDSAILTSASGTGSFTVVDLGETCTITATSDTFTENDIGRFIRIRHDQQWGVARISGYTDASHVSATVVEDFLYTTPSKYWRLGAWYTGNYPAFVTFHQQRLGFGRTPAEPQAFWLSVVGDYLNFNPYLVERYAITAANMLTNGDFNSDTAWTKGSGWTISGGTANKAAGVASNLYQTISVEKGKKYKLMFTVIGMTAGTIKGRLGATDAGVERTEDGEYIDFFTAAATSSITFYFVADSSFNGSIDTASFVEETGEGAYTVGDDSGISGTIHSDQVDVMAWLLSAKQLIAGSTGGIYTVKNEKGGGLSPSNIDCARENADQAAPFHRPMLVGSSVVYVHRARQKVLELIYNIQSDRQEAVELSIFSGHLLKGKIRGACQQHAPANILWYWLDNGTAVACVFEKSHQVVAWCQVETDGAIESMACIPGTTEDEVWMIVARDVGGSTKRYVEYMKPFDFGSVLADYYGVDCGLSGTFSPATSAVSGLDHLEGRTVKVVGDGLVQGDKVVASGAITLDTAAETVHVGLGYTGIIEPMPIEAGSQIGSAQGKKKNIDELLVNLYETCLGKYGPDTSNLYDIPETAAGALYTGESRPYFHGGWGTKATVVFVQDEPMPMTVLNLVPSITTVER